MHVLTACSRHFLVEYCRGWEFAHFECWLMGRLSTLFAFPKCWVRDLLLFPCERSVSGRCDLHHLGATEWTGTDVMPPLCGEVKSAEGSSISFFPLLFQITACLAFLWSVCLSSLYSFSPLSCSDFLFLGTGPCGTNGKVGSCLKKCFTSSFLYIDTNTFMQEFANIWIIH